MVLNDINMSEELGLVPGANFRCSYSWYEQGCVEFAQSGLRAIG